MLVDADDFAGLDFAHEGRADGVEGAGFAGDAPEAIACFAEHQRANAPRIAAGFDPIGEEKQQAERALQMLQHVRQRIVFFGVRRFGEQDGR